MCKQYTRRPLKGTKEMQRNRDSKKIWLSTPTMHGNEIGYVQEAFDKNWVAPLGFNVDAFEKEAANYLACNVHTLALNAGTAALPPELEQIILIFIRNHNRP